MIVTFGNREILKGNLAPVDIQLCPLSLRHLANQTSGRNQLRNYSVRKFVSYSHLSFWLVSKPSFYTLSQSVNNV